MTDRFQSIASRLAFLHRRPFWAVACGAVLAYGLGTFILYLFYNSFEISELRLIDIHIVSGAFIWGLFGGELFNSTIVAYLCLYIYYILLTFLLWKTFVKSRVQIGYPIIFILVMLIGYYYTTVYMNGL